MSIIIWVGFFLSFAFLLVIARKNLPLALIVASIILGGFSLKLQVLANTILRTLFDPSILLLALAVGIIPIIGGILEIKGQMDHLVDNLRIGRKPILAFTPALLGMLPMPGGALLSAPPVNKVAKGVDPAKKVVINLWFRHILFLIYPLAPALIASAKMANLEVYRVIPYLLPPFVFMIITGYLFFLKKIDNKTVNTTKTSLRKFSIPVSIILLAPLMDFILKKLNVFRITEISLVIAVLASLLVAIFITRTTVIDFKSVWKKMRPLRFSLIIIGMFLFLNVFKTSPIPDEISALSLPPSVLCIIVGLILGIVTGRIHVPASIVIPIYLADSPDGSMSAPVFAIAYFSIFLGYLLSPVHPCLVMTLEYFKVQLKNFFQTILPASILTIVFILLLSLLYFN